MKAKFIALIVAVPVAAFAMSAAIPGGGKDKPAPTSATTEKAAPLSTQAMQTATPQGSEAEAATADGARLSAAQLAEEMALGQAMMKEKGRTLFDEVQEWHWELSDPTNALLEDDLLVPVRKALHYNLDADMFSRCPSGVDAQVYELAENGQRGEGFLTRARGCRTLPLARFKFDTGAGLITLWVSDKAGYVAVDKWLKAYGDYEKEQEKKANG